MVFFGQTPHNTAMALSNEERERIREEEWIRATTRQDFERTAGRSSHDPNSLPGIAGMLLAVLGTVAAMFVFIRLFGGEGF